MEWQSGNPRIKPRGIKVPCNTCARDVPYDPTVINAVCSSCRHDANLLKVQTLHGLIPTHTERNCGYGFSHDSSMTPSSSLKRPADSLINGELPRKRTLTSAHGSSISPLIRRTVVGPAAQTSQGTRVVTDDEDEDEFENAQEELPSGFNDSHVTGGSDEEHKNDSMVSGAEQVEQYAESESVNSAGKVNYEGPIEIDSDVETDEERDLFNSAFGKKPSQGSNEDEDEVEVEDEDDGDDDEVQQDDESEEECDETEQEGETKLTSITAAKKPATEARGSPTVADQDRLSVDEPTRLSSTAPTPTPHGAQSPIGLVPPDPEADLSINLKRQQNFHGKAKELIPRLPLAEHRYWIGVLNVDVKPKSINNQTQFSWMKGNRLTTVQTVWHTYQTTTATDKFVLLLGHERPDKEVRMEELDYFNDKKVMFRAMWEGAAGSEGRSLIQDIIPAEVIELD